MDLASFTRKKGATLPEVVGDPEARSPGSQSPAASESVVVRDVTPNGTVIEYEAQPKRLYRVNGVEVPSVTTVLGILNKPQLVWWGMQKGVQGVLDLFAMGHLTTGVDWDTDTEKVYVEGEHMSLPASEESVIELLKEHKLTVNHRLDQAADRGVNVHDALETWARIGEMPRPEEYPESERGYVTGLLNFVQGHEVHPIDCELMVGSESHGFAGRFDLVVEISETVNLVTKCYPKRADKRTEVQAGRYLVDLKTSKGVYDSHKLQLAAYEFAAVECGYPATDGQAVLHVTADGKYELVFSDAKPEQFLAVKKAYDALEEL